MNAIKKILSMNENELQQNISDAASWHADYSDTSYIYIGNLHNELKEEDILKIFSQYGNPTHLNLIKDKDTGKSRGFCYLKYEDHRSCILAIDNFNGVKIFDRPLKIDHTYFRLLEGQNEDEFLIQYPAASDEKSQRVKELEGPKLLPYKPNHSIDENDDFSDPISSEMRSENQNLLAFTTSVNKMDDDDFDDPMKLLLMRPIETESKTRKRHHGKSRSHHGESKHNRLKKAKSEKS